MGISVLASGQKEYKESGIVTINQDTTLFFIKGDGDNPHSYSLAAGRQLYLFVTSGNVIIHDIHIGCREGVFIKNEKKLEFIFQNDSELILLDLPNLSA